MERLDKFIADRTDMSRKDVKQALKQGVVKVNGTPVRDSSLKIEPGYDRVTVSGKELVYKEHTYIMLNKPEGCVCSTRDRLSETVLSFVPEELMVRGLFPAGRLDKDSKGFVFLTDDGELAHRILSPKNHLTKYYLVKLEEEYKEEYEEAFASGLVIDGGEKCMPARVCGISHDPKYALVGLNEGKFHQVKRMFQTVGNKVTQLFRMQIGGLPIDGKLLPGECLELLNNEIEKMLSEIDFKDVQNYAEKSFWSYLINNKL